jgi:hypothetical protein
MQPVERAQQQQGAVFCEDRKQKAESNRGEAASAKQRPGEDEDGPAQ